MISWSISVYTRVLDTIVEGILQLIYKGDRGHMWVEISSPYSNIAFESNIRNGRVFFRDAWIDLNDDSTGITVGSILEFIYDQCKRVEDNKDSIRILYFDYLNSKEYFDSDFIRQRKRLLYGAMLELEENMNSTDSHDPHEEKYYELLMKHNSIIESDDLPIVATIKQTFGMEGDRDFMVSLIRKFIDRECDWV